VDPNGVAKDAGITQGNVPVEINGQAAEVFLERYNTSRLVFPTLINELVVVDNRGQLHSSILQGSTLSLMGLIQNIAWLFVSLIFWAVGFYVILKRPRNPASILLCLIGLFFGLMLSSNMIWATGVPKAAYVQVFAMGIGPWLFLHLFIILPEERVWIRNKPQLYLIYLPAAITIILFPIIGFRDDQAVRWFLNVRYLVAGLGFLGVIAVATINYFKATSTRTLQQMKIMLASCCAAFVPYAVLYIFPQAIWRESILPSEYGILLVSFIPLGMGYAIITRQLLDIDFIFRRGIIYGLITVVMATILSAGVFIVFYFQREVTVPEEILIALVLGAIATALFGPAKKAIEAWVDRALYKDRYDYRKIIQSLSISLNAVKDMTGVSRLVVGTVVNTLNLAGGCLFTKTQAGFEIGAAQGSFLDVSRQRQLLDILSRRDRQMEFPNKALGTVPELSFLVPLKAGEKEVGIICLSNKKTKQDFSTDDLFLIQGIASAAAMALHAALLIRDVSIRDTFVSVASHELRTPLTSVVGYADLLMSQDPPVTTRKRWLKNILDNSEKVTAMVDDLLNVSRIQSGRVSIKIEEINLSDLLQEVLTLCRESTSKHQFVVDIKHDLPPILADRDKFSQILGNLLNNAIKYSPNGGRIVVSANNEPLEARVVVSVADEGIGIAPEDRNLLFTTFHRIQRPETQGIRGSGLGLYIAKEWTEAMGGKIWVESEINKGSTFFVAMPTQDSHE